MEPLTLARRLSVFTLFGTLAGCSLNLDPAPTLGALNIDGRDVNYVSPRDIGGPSGGQITRLFAGTCMFGEAKQENAFAAALAPVALNFAVDTLGKLLQRAGEERAVAVYAALSSRVNLDDSTVASLDGDSTVSGGIQLGDRGGQVPLDSSSNALLIDCIQLVHGEFVGDASKAANPTWLSAIAETNSTTTDTYAEGFAEKNILLNDEPGFFIEAGLELAHNGSWTLRPHLLNYDRVIDTGKRDQDRGLFLELGINNAPHSLTSEKPSRGLLSIGRMTAGSETIQFGPNDPRAPMMLWTGAPAGSETSDQATNLEARLVELRDPNPVLAAIGELLAGETGDELADALRQDLFPTGAEEAAEVTAQIAALGEFQKAVSDYRTALTARKTALEAAEGRPDFDLIQSEQDSIVRAARLAVELAAAKAGVSAPAF